MKTALMALLVSFSSVALAQDCFVRNVELVKKEVSLAKEICIVDIALDLQPFSQSQAIVRYTLDGKPMTKTVRLYSPIAERDNGMVEFLVYNLDSSYDGGFCGYTIEAQTLARLTVKKDGSEARITSVEGEVGTSSDNCHSSSRVIQSFSYEAL